MTCNTGSAAALALLALATFTGSGADDALAGTDLVMSFLLNDARLLHNIAYSTDPDALEALTAPYGYGQLTDVGKRTGYRLGEYIRARYGALLAPQYNRSEIYIRSTDSTRAKMTVLTAMSAVFPSGAHNWNPRLPWQPTPYTTVPAKYDPNLAVLNCPTFLNFYRSQFLTSPSYMASFDDTLEQWSAVLGFNITQMPVFSYAIYDVYTSQISLGLPLDDTLEKLYPSIQAVAGAAIDVIFGNDDYIALQAGVLLNEFVTTASAAASGNVTQRVRIYSAHDYNVYSFMAVTRVTPRQGVPKYGAAFSLELRRRVDSGAFVVLPVYLPAPGEAPVYLQVEGCSALLCELDEFLSLTADYVLDESSWRDQCGFTEDLEIDDSSIA